MSAQDIYNSQYALTPPSNCCETGQIIADLADIEELLVIGNECCEEQTVLLTAIENNTDNLPAALGQTTMANSLPVVIASDQTSLPTNLTAALPAGTNNIGDVDIASSVTLTVQGTAADGAAVVGPPVRIAGKDDVNNTQDWAMETFGGGRVVLYAVNGNQITVISPAADGQTNAVVPLVSSSYPFGFNGTTWDRHRNNIEGTALASAARTVSTLSADIINYNHSACIAYLNVTSASGTGGLQLQFEGKDPVSGTYRLLNSLPTAIIATGITAYAIGLGVANLTSGIAQICGVPLPRTWRIRITAGDASSYTYSVGYALIV